MNTMSRLISSLAAVITLSLPLYAGSVEVYWENTDNYSDLGTDFHDDTTVKMFAEEMEPYIKRQVHDHLPDNQSMRITITNVDLAGEFEPWRLADDVRIVRDIYPPRMEFDYTIYDSEGNIIESATENISDIDFMFNIGRRFVGTDEFFYEKEMFQQWISQELS